MIKKSRQKFKYLDNENSFSGETKIIFQNFNRVFIEKYKIIFLEV